MRITKKMLSLVLIATVLITAVPINCLESKATSNEANNLQEYDQAEYLVHGEPEEEYQMDASYQSDEDGGTYSDNQNDYTYDEEYGGLYITSCNIQEETVEIPSQIDGKEVLGIRGLNNQAIKYLIIPEGVKYIESLAGCSSLTTVTIPKSVISIGSFEGCSSLTTITIPEGVRSIGDYAFYECSSLTSVIIPENVTDIGFGAFSWCSNLATITIPEGVTKIREYTFNGCSSLTTVAIAKSVTSIEDSAFSGCSSLISVVIPEKVRSIEYNTFSGCSSLITVTIPEGVIKIGESAFSGCSSLINVALPDGMTYIGDSTFSGCSSLTNVTLPDSVTHIGHSAFENCSSLTTVTIPEGVTSIEFFTFAGCSGLGSVTIPNGITEINRWAFSGCSSLTTVTIPDGVRRIYLDTFAECSSLTSIIIPESVEWIEEYAFDRCDKLNTIYYTGSETEWNTISKNIGNTFCTVIYDYVGLFLDGVKVDATKAEVDPEVGLFVTRIEDEDIVRNILVNCFENYNIAGYVIYDISLRKGANKIQPNGSVMVSFLVPERMKGSNCKVFYINDAGNATDMNAIYKDGYMTFATDHFSYYAIVYEAPPVTLSGSITCTGDDSEPMDIRLIHNNEEISYISTHEYTYSFENVGAGTYTLEVSKKNHVTHTYEIVVTDEDVVQDVKIHLLGDITGDGKVNTIDVNRVYAHVRETSLLTGYELECANVVGNNATVNTIDVNRIYAHVKETNLLW